MSNPERMGEHTYKQRPTTTAKYQINNLWSLMSQYQLFEFKNKTTQTNRWEDEDGYGSKNKCWGKRLERRKTVIRM